VLAVAHREFKAMGAEAIRSFGRSAHVLFDLKYILPADASDLRL
jgi:UDP-N-acetyl-D-glucosamine/UDP-N-acetyl-D-galactosamine dehydrogenase